MKEIFLLLGSNRGDRQAYLEKARTMIVEECGPVIRSSSLFETEPWKFKDDIPFINQVIEIDSGLPPEELLAKLLEIEVKLGRERVGSRQSAVCCQPPFPISHQPSPISNLPSLNSQLSILNYQFGPRTIDLDILFYGNKMIFTEKLMIPHPRLHERRFTLEPLNEIAPSFQHPVLKKTISLLLQQCTDQGKVTRLDCVY